MVFRVLCLHGMGTNPAIFRNQTVGLRSFLPQDWEWVFVEGDEDTLAASGMASIYPGPYLCYYSIPTEANIQDVLDLVDDVVERQGPFDAIMGFSQGAAVALSAVLKWQLENPYERPRFPIGIFICSNLPYAWNDQEGVDITSLLLSGHTLYCESLPMNLSTWKSMSTQMPELSQATIELAPLHVRPQLQQMAQNGDSMPRIRGLHAEATSSRIEIPTVHVYGAKDELRQQSLGARNLCDSRLTYTVEHDGGHSIPRSANRDIAMAIQNAVSRAEFMF